jgi:hypothetical protein
MVTMHSGWRYSPWASFAALASLPITQLAGKTPPAISSGCHGGNEYIDHIVIYRFLSLHITVTPALTYYGLFH